MGIQIVSVLVATPSVTGLPAIIRLRQTLMSNFPGGEAVGITYTIDGGGQIAFEGGHSTFQVAGVHIPETQLAREDMMGLVRIGGTGPAQALIRQQIESIDGPTNDSVVVAIVG